MVKIKVRENDSKAEIKPFDKAVNKPDANIFSPEKIKEIEKSLSPTSESFATCALSPANNELKSGAEVKASISIIMEETRVKDNEYRISFLIYFIFPAP